MTLDEILPTVDRLSPMDKIQLMGLLAAELYDDEELPLVAGPQTSIPPIDEPGNILGRMQRHWEATNGAVTQEAVASEKIKHGNL